MKSEKPVSEIPEEPKSRESIPDESRRRVLGKLGLAAVLVPVVTLIADASSNVAAAS